MKWIKQTDPECLPGWVCGRCGSLVVQVDSDTPPKECKACGAGGDNLSDRPLHKGGTPPMAAKGQMKMPAPAKEPDVFTDVTGRESIIEGIYRAQIEAERRCIKANAVMINDAMFFSKLPMPPYGEPRMICGLRAFYCPSLPPDVSFAVCEVSMPENRDPIDVDKAMAFIESYAFNDSKEFYTNGIELVPLFRVEQALVDKAYNGLFDGG